MTREVRTPTESEAHEAQEQLQWVLRNGLDTYTQGLILETKVFLIEEVDAQRYPNIKYVANIRLLWHTQTNFEDGVEFGRCIQQYDNDEPEGIFVLEYIAPAVASEQQYTFVRFGVQGE